MVQLKNLSEGRVERMAKIKQQMSGKFISLPTVVQHQSNYLKFDSVHRGFTKMITANKTMLGDNLWTSEVPI